jgi:DNA-3-methyladenine glycosylase I
MSDAVVGADGRARCGWGLSAPEYIAYHDEEWGVPLHGTQALFERMSLEAFQSGLSWLIILRKRESFRRAFDGFDPSRVVDLDLDRLLWSFAPADHIRPASGADVPAVTPESKAMAKELKRRGFAFVGPTTCYAMMQATGMVDDHLADCWRSGLST